MDPSTINGRTTAEAVITEIIGEEGIRLHKEIGFRLLLATAEAFLHSLRLLIHQHSGFAPDRMIQSPAVIDAHWNESTLPEFDTGRIRIIFRFGCVFPFLDARKQ